MSKHNSIRTDDRLNQKALHHEPGLRRGRLSPHLPAAGLVALLWTTCVAMPLHASELNPLAIALVESSGTTYFEPVGQRIVIRTQPARLFLRIRNTSEAAVLVRANPGKACAIELKDQAGLTTLVKRKEAPGSKAEDDIRVNLSPGADTVIPIPINGDTWEGFPDLKAGQESKYTVRIVYDTVDGRHIYSEPYTLVFSIKQ